GVHDEYPRLAPVAHAPGSPVILLLPAQFHKALISLRHLAADGVARMQQHAITQLQVLAFIETHQLVVAFHGGELGVLVAAEGVRRHQAVAADMPDAGVSVLRIGEDGEADFLAVDRAGVIAPGGDLAPAVFLADLPLGVLDLALAGLARIDDVVDADAE